MSENEAHIWTNHTSEACTSLGHLEWFVCLIDVNCRFDEEWWVKWTFCRNLLKWATTTSTVLSEYVRWHCIWDNYTDAHVNFHSLMLYPIDCGNMNANSRHCIWQKQLSQLQTTRMMSIKTIESTSFQYFQYCSNSFVIDTKKHLKHTKYWKDVDSIVLIYSCEHRVIFCFSGMAKKYTLRLLKTKTTRMIVSRQ